MLNNDDRMMLRRKVAEGWRLSMIEVAALVIDARIFEGWTVTGKDGALVLQRPVAVLPNALAQVQPVQQTVMMLKAIYAALKPGGEFVVGDYSAKPGAGTSVVRTLHRSDEALVTAEIEAVGFKLTEHEDFLRVLGDMRDTPSHSAAQPVDIYLLKFRKPG
jgi:predicted methyltransferase